MDPCLIGDCEDCCSGVSCADSIPGLTITSLDQDWNFPKRLDTDADESVVCAEVNAQRNSTINLRGTLCASIAELEADGNVVSPCDGALALTCAEDGFGINTGSWLLDNFRKSQREGERCGFTLQASRYPYLIAA